jgi:hypothetical protein
MPVTQCGVAHIRELDIAFRAGIHENVALCRMEFSSRDNLREFLHVSWLDVHNVYVDRNVMIRANRHSTEQLTETLIADVQIPEVDPQIISRNVRLLI